MKMNHTPELKVEFKKNTFRHLWIEIFFALKRGQLELPNPAVRSWLK